MRLAGTTYGDPAVGRQSKALISSSASSRAVDGAHGGRRAPAPSVTRPANVLAHATAAPKAGARVSTHEQTHVRRAVRMRRHEVHLAPVTILPDPRADPAHVHHGHPSPVHTRSSGGGSVAIEGQTFKHPCSSTGLHHRRAWRDRCRSDEDKRWSSVWPLTAVPDSCGSASAATMEWCADGGPGRARGPRQERSPGRHPPPAVLGALVCGAYLKRRQNPESGRLSMRAASPSTRGTRARRRLSNGFHRAGLAGV